MERFFWSLQHEWAYRQAFDHLAGAGLSLFKCIESFYNPRRLPENEPAKIVVIESNELTQSRKGRVIVLRLRAFA